MTYFLCWSTLQNLSELSIPCSISERQSYYNMSAAEKIKEHTVAIQSPVLLNANCLTYE